MLQLNQTNDMGLEASLKLLDLPPDAGIDDANQAYTRLHRMIDTYHRGLDDDDGSGRQEDLDLLTCAYEKAVAYFSSPETHPDSTDALRSAPAGGQPSGSTHDTLTFDMPLSASPPLSADTGGPSFDPGGSGVKEQIVRTSEHLKQVEASLPAAGTAVDSATAAMQAAEQRLAAVREQRIDAEVAARSAKTRARLLEIEANRSMEDAIAVAEKARRQVIDARKAARQAGEAARAAADQIDHLKVSEKEAADHAIQARQRLEAAQAQARDLTHGLVETRHRLELLNRRADATTTPPDSTPAEAVAGLAADGGGAGGSSAERRAVLQDLLDIEAMLKADRQTALPGQPLPVDVADGARERRRHPRLVYPVGEGPLLHMAGQRLAIADLSRSGLRLAAGADMGCERFVRGSIDFAGGSCVAVTGKVVRQDVHGVGVKLVTRIGNRLLDKERMRLGA